MVICTQCKQSKQEVMFRNDTRKTNGLRSHCLECERKNGREYRRIFYQKNKEHVKRINAQWKRDNVEKARAQQRRQRLRLREAVLNHYSNGNMCCACCNETEVKFLCIDHINNNGAEERKRGVKTGYAFYVYLRRNNFPEGYQVLCHNCNMAKGFYGACPHTEQ